VTDAASTANLLTLAIAPSWPAPWRNLMTWRRYIVAVQQWRWVVVQDGHLGAVRCAVIGALLTVISVAPLS